MKKPYAYVPIGGRGQRRIRPYATETDLSFFSSLSDTDSVCVELHSVTFEKRATLQGISQLSKGIFVKKYFIFWHIYKIIIN